MNYQTMTLKTAWIVQLPSFRILFRASRSNRSNIEKLANTNILLDSIQVFNFRLVVHYCRRSSCSCLVVESTNLIHISENIFWLKTHHMCNIWRLFSVCIVYIDPALVFLQWALEGCLESSLKQVIIKWRDWYKFFIMSSYNRTGSLSPVLDLKLWLSFCDCYWK